MDNIFAYNKMEFNVFVPNTAQVWSNRNGSLLVWRSTQNICLGKVSGGAVLDSLLKYVPYNTLRVNEEVIQSSFVEWCVC